MAASPASRITKAASKQTYYTIRFLVDQERIEDAYRAYGYFRWVDDSLDSPAGSDSERISFLARQESLLSKSLRGGAPRDVGPEEKMLIELVQHDHEKHRGLRIYLRNMMQVMDFDVKRRGRLISQAELNEYTRWLASAVMECIHYFIGHGDFSPQDGTRYMAVSGAHIAHMLRDTFDDVRMGYYNVPLELLDANRIGPLDVHNDAYRSWVKSRVALARDYFDAGKCYLARVENPRCRVACFAYIARFQWLLDTLEREAYLLRPQYNERKSAGTAWQMFGSTLASTWAARGLRASAGQVGSPGQTEVWYRNP